MRAAPKVQRAVVQGSVVVVLELIEVLVLDDMVVLLVEETVLDEELFVVEVLLVDDVVLEPLVLDVTDELVLELVEVVVLDDVLVLVVTVGLERVRGPIIELQEGRCFYCAERLARRAGQTPDVDHFIPWSRYPDDGLENLVVVHAHCNAQKSDFLAAAAHVDHWRARTRSGSPVSAELDRVAEA